ncbi:MAG: hypothetical protein AAF569_02150 [Pseudomonadota bacterium]
MKFFKFAFLSLPIVLLGACVDQTTVDEKMAKGCVAGVNALLNDTQVIDVSGKTAVTEDFQGEGLHRRITMKVIEKDGWLELENEYSCVFLEQWGPFRADHKAMIMQVKINDDVYGKQDGKIVGDWDDFVALSRVVDAAMGQ